MALLFDTRISLSFHVLVKAVAIDPYSLADFGCADAVILYEFPQRRTPEARVPLSFGITQPRWLYLLSRARAHHLFFLVSLFMLQYDTARLVQI